MPLSLFNESVEPVLPPWKILIVDDEEDIHTITKMALKRFELEGRNLQFFHAYSAKEGMAILEKETDIALIFLDVVMETDDAGLKMAAWIRQTLENKFIRIVLRTGQPGQAPEEKVIVDYDINDYKEKTELSRKKLFTTVFSALRAYRDIVKIEDARKYQELYRSGLERVIDATSNVLEKHTLKEFFTGLLQQVISLLQVNEASILLPIKAVSALVSENDYEIIAQSNGHDLYSGSIDKKPFVLTKKVIDPEQIHYFNEAIKTKKSFFKDDVLVGYFPSNRGQVSLLYLKGIKSITDIDSQLLEVFATNVSLAFDNLLLNQEIIDTQEELIYRLGDVVESRSEEAGHHVRRMSEVCYMLAILIGFSEDEANLLKQASPMHDIGKIATPDKVLLKPGKLLPDEMDIMKLHPAIGYKILKGSKRPILKAAAIISQQHHEKFDGTGYPSGIEGENIHIYARIAAVADVFDALTHKRCYKDIWPLPAVIDYIKQSSGIHLDPTIVNALLDNIDQALAINEQYKEH
jgi:response regulator RpfG family c-di-GMP phosphodiesterase